MCHFYNKTNIIHAIGRTFNLCIRLQNILILFIHFCNWHTGILCFKRVCRVLTLYPIDMSAFKNVIRLNRKNRKNHD